MSGAYPSESDIFEHGIIATGSEIQIPLNVLATTRLPIYSGYDFAIVDSDGSSLNERAIQLAQVNRPHAVADFYEESDVRYCLLATLYHLNQLIRLYTDGCRLFDSTYPSSNSTEGNFNNPRVFYEIDALLGSAKRVYESIRKVLWKHYAPGPQGRWKSIRKAVESPDIPEPFRSELRLSWDTYGETLADYRNCVAHYDPLTDGATTCWMERYEDRWGMTVKLPSNPSAKSRSGYNFDSGPEALRYCHSIAAHLVDLSEQLTRQSTVSQHLNAHSNSS
ncbi:hypothetical protein [Rhodococcus sp. T7]|uniref:hypothetical protein n=1 Tax=Rhodococcus sp. T7 TaxID=627444 RepID=UPI00135C8BA2|nr:hypothetical protein [Rhodococcus sp. T7]KAF0957352.1 hypothetical protein MLGJGCBP_09183 [Rhodococcus sp. T7]KAF0966728.1 hypothetical protein MLGJGCBP_00102 [Rhodococcus sp. T7]